MRRAGGLCAHSAVRACADFGQSVALVCGCASPGVVFEEDAVSDGFSGCVRVSNGVAELVVCPSLGRVVRYSFCGEDNVLWTNPDADKFADALGGWHNYGGEKMWVWPQTSWPPVPGIEKGPYKATKLSDGIRMEYSDGVMNGVRAVRTYRFKSTHGSEIVCDMSLELPAEKDGSSGGRVWTVTQVPLSGARVFVSEFFPGREWVRLSSDPALPSVNAGAGPGGMAELSRNPGLWMKSGTDGAAAAVLRRGVLFTIRSEGITPGDIEYGEGLQICVSPDESPCFPEYAGPYAEIEFTGIGYGSGSTYSSRIRTEWSLHRVGK